MGTRDPRIDTYIERSADFAQPILAYLRELVHEECPEVAETMKWSFPHFVYRGILCSMASFKAHCAFTFWRGTEVLGDAARDDAMGHFGKITSVADLPSRRMMKGYVNAAMKLNEQGAASRAALPRQKREVRPAEMSVELAASLSQNASARDTYERLSPSQQREYNDWIAEPKTDATRRKRVATTVEWLSEGKRRNWKFERK